MPAEQKCNVGDYIIADNQVCKVIDIKKDRTGHIVYVYDIVDIHRSIHLIRGRYKYCSQTISIQRVLTKEEAEELETIVNNLNYAVELLETTTRELLSTEVWQKPKDKGGLLEVYKNNIHKYELVDKILIMFGSGNSSLIYRKTMHNIGQLLMLNEIPEAVSKYIEIIEDQYDSNKHLIEHSEEYLVSIYASKQLFDGNAKSFYYC